MTLAEDFQAFKNIDFTYTISEIFSLIDLTLLDAHAEPQAIETLEKRAIQHQVAAVCMFPQHLPKLTQASSYLRATVVNFPQGNDSQKQVLEQIDHIIHTYNPDEIDYVFPYSLYLAGNKNEALQHCKKAFQLCQEAKIAFKVILETGAFPIAESIYEASLGIIDNGCNFLKTSTGNIPIGATPLAAFSVLQALKKSAYPCGIKLSGGIKTKQQALYYMALSQQIIEKPLDTSWFRIGASSLIDDLISRNNRGP